MTRKKRSTKKTPTTEPTLGAIIKEIRETHQLSRGQTIHNYYRVAEKNSSQDFDLIESRGEGWLARFETQNTNISSRDLHWLLLAIGATDGEKARVFILSDRSPWPGTSSKDLALAQFCIRLGDILMEDKELSEAILGLCKDKQIDKCDTNEIMEILLELLELRRLNRSSQISNSPISSSTINIA